MDLSQPSPLRLAHGLEVHEATRAALTAYAEDRFLHQVREPRGARVVARDDLREALEGSRPLPGNGPWRVHFHVPVHADPEPPLRSTRDHLVGSLTGLVGAGRTEVARAIFGLSPLTAGTVEISGAPVAIGSPAAAARAGIAYVPEDRKGDGIVPVMTVRENISLPVLRRLSNGFGRVRRGAERELAQRYVRQFSIVPPDGERRIGLLSGGNQQKAVISRWLATDPKVLILDEPTRGVDVGAKAEIHGIIGQLVANGMAVVMISSELPEIMGVCDRVVVMRDGRASAPIAREGLTEERIMALATGEENAEGEAA